MGYAYLVYRPVGLLVMRVVAMMRWAVVWRSIMRWVMRMLVVLLEVDDVVIERALKPRLDIDTRIMDLAVDVLHLILHFAKHLIGSSQSAIEDVLSVVENSLLRYLNVPEHLSVGNDEG
jgi:hypothetical protein